MIEKLDLNWVGPHDRMIAKKLNEVIGFINQEDNKDKVEKACRQAIETGSYTDLKKYLELRRKYL